MDDGYLADSEGRLEEETRDLQAGKCDKDEKCGRKRGKATGSLIVVSPESTLTREIYFVLSLDSSSSRDGTAEGWRRADAEALGLPLEPRHVMGNSFRF
jgi:hypothetical protein